MIFFTIAPPNHLYCVTFLILCNLNLHSLLNTILVRYEIQHKKAENLKSYFYENKKKVGR